MADALDPISWVAIEFIAGRLRGVTQATGYRTDLGLGTVTDNPAQHERAGTAMHTLVSSGPIADKPEASGRRTKISDMDVIIEVTVPFDSPDNPARLAHRARADVVRALGDGAASAAAGLRSIDITGSSFDIGVAADGAAVVIAQISARAGLAESTQPAP